jgi:large subunit ribosomal protein L23
MELNIYDIIKGIVSTPKSLLLQRKFGQLTFKVNKLSNKIMIKEAVEKIWDVKVDKVRITLLKGKARKSGKRAYTKSDLKKAMVTLKPGYKIALPDQYESIGAPDVHDVSAEKGER